MYNKINEKLIHVANGRQKADLVLKNANIINVFTESIEVGDVAVVDGMIAGIGTYEGVVEKDMTGKYLCPGFIDGHIHLESSMVAPTEFEKAVLPHGTTAVVTDPHEIANVAGCEGIEFMLKYTQDMTLDVLFVVPSCVPATGLDEAGACLEAADIAPFYDNDRVIGLAEMMNSFGVNQADPAILDKINATLEHQRIIDGHAPLLSGQELNGYVAAGIRSDHECSNAQEAKEKFARGQWIMVREGTAAHNLEALLPLFEAPYARRIMLVTDDKHPCDLLRDGHIDAIVRKAVQRGVDPITAIKAGTYNAASYFGLVNNGAIAPGYCADIAVLDNLTDLNVLEVYKDGVLVAEGGKSLVESTVPEMGQQIQERVYHSFHVDPVDASQLALEKKGEHIRVIDLNARELLTTERTAGWSCQEGCADGVDPEEDIVKIVALERHKNTGHIGKGFLGKYGLKKGAVATSVGHDSHNLVVAGTNDEDIACAANRVIKNEGGLAIALNGEIVADLPLQLAGLMSTLPLEEVDQRLEKMKAILREWGIPEEIDPFMTLSFVSLPVIPFLRLNTYGVIDVNQQKIVDASF